VENYKIAHPPAIPQKGEKRHATGTRRLVLRPLPLGAIPVNGAASTCAILAFRRPQNIETALV